MKRATNRVLPLAAILLLPFLASAQVSPLFQGTTADVWVVDDETGQVTGYDRGTWITRFLLSDYVGAGIGQNDVVLINNLPDSSLRMQAGQPAISLAGIGDAALSIGAGGASGHRDLILRPAGGPYSDTIAVVIGASASVLSQDQHRLTWTATETATSTTVASGNRVLERNAGGTEDGYHYETFYLVNTGNYTVSATLRGVGTNETVTANYDLSIAPGNERRDTDGDGIPDAVEVDMGLNPFEDDWTADTDGNGWSQFDEWLRRYCLDPNTLQPLDGGPECLDVDGLPLDSDNDNWTDFDEILRGTNHLDPEPVIVEQIAAPPGNSDDGDPAPDVQPVVPGSEYETLQRLRFKDFPAANRLYEVEHFIAAGAGLLSVPATARILLEQQSAGANQGEYHGIVVQSITATKNNIAGIDVRVAASADEFAGVEDIYFNIWADSLRDGELLLAQKIDDVEINGDPDRPVVVRFEPVAVTPGETIYFEFRKKSVALVTTGADTLGGGGVVEVDGVASSGLTDLVLDVYYDANFANGIGGTRAGMQWWTIGAANLDGTLAYDAIRLLHDSDITAAGLLPTDISPRRRMTVLANALGGSRLPEMRLPAGDSMVVTAVHRHHVPEQIGWRAPADYSRIYKNWLPRTNDVTPTAMLTENGVGAWTTPAEWRREFIAYLVPRLVVPAAVTLDESTTLEVAIVEAALSEEARLDGSGGIQLLNGIFQPAEPIFSYQPGQPIFGDLLSHQSSYTNAWEDHLERLAVADFNLDQSIEEVRAALLPGQPLEPLGQWLRERFYAGVPGTASDKYMARQTMIAFPDVCKVPTAEIATRQADVDGWNAFLDQCPAWVDDAEYALLVEEMRDRCYAVRLNLLPGATSEIGGDATLLDRSVDSDNDGAINRDEIELPVRDLTLPWLFDSDGDSIADSVDPCPNDPYNDCSADPIRPNVTLEADFSVFEPEAGSDFALVSVQLERIYDVPVTVCFEAIMDLGDTATPDIDFQAITGCVIIAPGQLSALIAIPINADGIVDGGETFTVRITSVSNGTIADDGVVVITINNTDPGANTAPVFTSPTTIDVIVNDVATGYTATATDDDGDNLTFSISDGADQAAFSIDSASGVLRFVQVPDFDAPGDANGDNDYEVQLSVDDGRGGVDTLDLVVTIVEAQLIFDVTYPTPNANLGGGVTSTIVTGSVANSIGTPLDPTAVTSISINGVSAAIDVSDPAHWRWSLRIPVSEGPNVLDVSRELGDGTVIDTQQNLENTGVHSGFGDSEADFANNRILVIDGFIDGLLSVDLASGDRTVVSAVGMVGSGATFNSPRGVVLDSANNRALIVDWQRDALIAVNLTSGNRTDISRNGIGAGIALDGPNALAFDPANNRVFVVATIDDVIVAVDLATGDRTNISGLGVGSGPAIGGGQGIVFDGANNRVLASGSGAIIAVDIASGNRTVVSDNAVGTGPTLSSPLDMTLDSTNNRVLVADQSRGLFAVDVASGDRTLLSDPGADYGRNASRIQSVVLDSLTNTAYVPDSTQDVIFAMDLTAGTRTVLSDSFVGTGSIETGMWVMRGLALDESRNRLLLLNWETDTLLDVNLSNAERSVVSNSNVGSGPLPTFPGRLVVDEANDRALFTDQNLFALVATNLATGDRSVLSNNASIGSGPQFNAPADTEIDAANDRAFVLDSALGLLQVNLLTGDRSIVSDAATGSGPLFGYADGLDIDFASNIGYVVDDGGSAVISVDITTGNRAILSDNAGVGAGPSISFPNDIQLDPAGNRAFIINRGGGPNLMAVNLANGDRTIISGAGVGTGVVFQSPYFIELDLDDDRAFVYDLAVTGVIVVDLSTGERALASK